MFALLVHVLVTAGLLLVVGRIVDGIEIRSGRAALIGAVVLGLSNALLRPVLVLLTFPLTMLTLGLFLFVINAIMLMMTAAVVEGFSVRNFRTALFGSVVLSILNFLVSRLFG